MNTTKEFIETEFYYMRLCYGLYCLLYNNFDRSKLTSHIELKKFKIKDEYFDLLLSKGIIRITTEKSIWICWDIYDIYSSEVREMLDEAVVESIKKSVKSWYYEPDVVL